MTVLSSLHRFAFVLALTGAAPGATWAAPAVSAARVALPQPAALEGLLRGDGELRVAGRALDRAPLLAIYEKRGFQPIWNGKRETELRQALGEAEAQGINPVSFIIPDTAPAEH